MQVAEKSQALVIPKFDPVQTAVIRTLLYFDIFDYPLTKEEISAFSSERSSLEEIELSLDSLVNNGVIYKYGEFFLARNENGFVARRKLGNELAAEFLTRARKYSRLISKFPFVKGVCISGSLSKGYADENSDVDYFIITSPGRLWVCRTFLIAFKKLFLLNSKKYFCVNYFVDETNLVIPDRNIYTAIEMATLLPMVNEEAWRGLMEKNDWVQEMLPNNSRSEFNVPGLALNQDPGIPNAFKRLLEYIFSGTLGSYLEARFQRITTGHWKRKFPQFNKEEFDHRFRSGKTVSKHHPNGFQSRVLFAFNSRIADFEERYGAPVK